MTIVKDDITPKFSLFEIDDNPDGWGPSTVPEKFSDLPYQPFNKDIKLGKIADWTSTYNPESRKNKFNLLNAPGNQYAYFHEEDESTFHTVNTVKEQKSNYIRQRNRFAANRTRRDKVLQKQQQQIEQQTRLGLTKKQKYINRERQQDMRRINKQFGRLNTNSWNNDYRRQNRVHREASVQVKDTWKVVEEIEFCRFSKLSLSMADSTATDLMLCGEMAHYDKNFDRVSMRNPTKLKLMNRVIHSVSTGDDPIIRKLAEQRAGNVFATDSLIACLMCCSRSVESWDITAQRVGDMLFLDKRPGNTGFDFVTVNETAVEPPADDGNGINSAAGLSLEATFINHNFVQQVLHAERAYAFPNANPFVEDDEERSNLGSVGYRYRRFDLGNEIKLVVRCEHDAVIEAPPKTSGENSGADEAAVAAVPLFLTVRALNEWDSRQSGGIDWRAKLDIQRGAVLGSEIKNNAFKLAKWTVSALLAGSDQLKLGYVTRETAKVNNAHVILGTQQFKPAEFATQINLKMDNAWGVLRSIIDLCMKLEQGLYLIMKDPNKQILRIYDVPNDAFEDEADANSDEEEEEEN